MLCCCSEEEDVRPDKAAPVRYLLEDGGHLESDLPLQAEPMEEEQVLYTRPSLPPERGDGELVLCFGPAQHAVAAPAAAGPTKAAGPEAEAEAQEALESNNGECSPRLECILPPDMMHRYSSASMSTSSLPITDMDSSIAVDVATSQDLERNMEESNATRDQLSTRLEHAKRQARLRRLRISVPTFVAGWSLLLSGEAATFIWISGDMFYLGTLAATFGAPIGLLALLPSDNRAILLVGIGACLAMLLWAVFRVVKAGALIIAAQTGPCEFYNQRMPCWMGYYHAGRCFLLMLLGLCIIFQLGRSLRHRRAVLLRTVWRCSGAFFLVQGIFGFLLAVCVDSAIGASHDQGWELACFVISCLVGTAMYHSKFRQRSQAWLASRGEATAAAAGIAELLGRKSVHEVLLMAQGTFRYVPANKLRREDFADNRPNPSLASLTKPGRLGAVDAFVSHSWHDSEAEKWAALQCWRREFKAQNKREPKLWIDKYCIDQEHLDDSLACLPVYLSGCKTFLALTGATYFNRLWCIMEIYIFIEMGGAPSSFCFRPLGNDIAAATSLKASIEAFDVTQAQCFLQRDTDRLLEVIEAGSCGMHGIEDLVRRTFAEVLLESNRRAESAVGAAGAASSRSDQESNVRGAGALIGVLREVHLRL